MALSPINYLSTVNNPIEEMNRGIATGIARRLQPLAEEREQAAFDRQQVLQGQQDTIFEQGQQDRTASIQERVEAVAAGKAQARQFQEDLTFLSQNPEAENYASVLAKYPEQFAPIKSVFQEMTGEYKDNTILGMAQVYSAIETGNVDIAKQMLDDRLEASVNSGKENEAQSLRAMRDLLDVDPSAVKMSLGLNLSAMGDGKFDNLLGQGTVKSSNNFKDGTIIRVMSNGARVVTNPAGDVVTGQVAADAIRAANAFETQVSGERAGARRAETLQQNINLGGEAEATTQSARVQIQKAEEAMTAIPEIKLNISNYRAAQQALRDGAASGVIQSNFPNINEASKQLENIRGRLGLDVISSVTFGALSEKEMQMAMDVALPTNMDEQTLMAWLEDRAVAQTKALNIMQEAAAFLSNPKNTMQDWIALSASSVDGNLGAQGLLEQFQPQQSALSGAQNLMQQFGGGQ